MNTSKKRCKVCKSYLYQDDIIKLKNAPNSAQNFVSKKNILNNKSITLTIKQCSNCGLVQAINKPVNYYKNVIRAVGFSPSMLKFRKVQFKNFCKEFNLRNKRVLEVGSGTGDYLSILGKTFKKSYGLENSKKNYKICKKKGLNIIKGFLKKKNNLISKNKFDAFFIFSYLEHIPNINIFLNAINQNLKNNGVGIVEVPNFDMILKKKLYSEFIIDHLFYFTKETLIKTLKINGFQVLKIDSIWDDYILSAKVKKILGKKITNLKNNLKKTKKIKLKDLRNHFKLIRKKINELNSNYKKNDIAVWGAGHQSLTLISQTKLINKIKYIVDSAKFKQNKFAPGINLKIVSPAQFIKDSLKVIIVLGGGYSREICEIVRSKNKFIKILYLKNNKFIYYN